MKNEKKGNMKKKKKKKKNRFKRKCEIYLY